MARLFWLTVMAAFAAALLAGASWAGAFMAVGTLLGSPPPEMGTQSTSFLWGGMPQLPDHPRVWRFTFTPTVIPGAPTDRKSTRLNSSHDQISYAVFCLKKKKK